jgi:hypothetical protein
MYGRNGKSIQSSGLATDLNTDNTKIAVSEMKLKVVDWIHLVQDKDW